MGVRGRYAPKRRQTRFRPGSRPPALCPFQNSASGEICGLTDAYRYRPGQGWTRIADLPHAVVAAPTVAWDDHHILVFGGDDGRLAAQGTSLGDKHPGFRHEILSYDTKTDRWGVVQELPSLTVTTPASVRGRTIFIPTGEDRPGHRTTAVKALEPTANAQAGQR